MKKPASVSLAHAEDPIDARKKIRKSELQQHGGRASDRSGHGRNARRLPSLWLAPLAEISVDERPVPPLAGRNAGRRRRRLRMFSRREQHDSGRQGELAPGME